MRQALLVLGYRLRAVRRLIAAEAFAIFVLGPLVLGGALWVVDRYLPFVRAPLAALVRPGEAPGPLGLGLALLWTVLFLPQAAAEVFPARRPGAVLDALPMAEGSRFTVAVVALAARQTVAVLLAAVVLVALDEGRTGAADVLLWLGRLALALLSIVPLTLALALARVRWGLPRSGSWRVLAVLAAVSAGVLALPPAARLGLLLPWRPAAAQLEAALASALAAGPATAPAGWAVAAAALAGLAAGVLWRLFRRRDLERAEDLALRRTPARLGPRLATRLGRAFAAQLGRDLRLVARGFSPVVYLSAALAVVCLAWVAWVLPDLGLGALLQRRLGVLGGMAAALALASLAPLLLKHQLPRLWLERSTPTAPEDLWRTKLWLARLLALPAVVAAAALLAVQPVEGTPTSTAMVPGLEPESLAVALLVLLMASWIVSSTVGLASFELAAQPILGLVFSALVAVAVAALFVFYPQAWWLWLVFYLVVAGKLAERATRRVHLMERLMEEKR